MPISVLKAQQIALYAPRQCVPFFMGPPGFGKSKGVTFAAAKRAGAVYMEQYAAVKEAVDASGLPYLIENPNGTKLTGWAPPGTFPTEALRDRLPQDREIRVNLDDFPQASPPVQKAYIRAAYGDGAHRCLGDVPVLQNVMFMGTGNRETDRAGASKPFTYVGNRVTFVEVEPDVKEWVSGALGGFAVPQPDADYPALRVKIDANVAKGMPDVLPAWIMWSKCLHNFTPEARSFLSPRSIECLGMWMRAFEVVGIDGDVLAEVASGTIGESKAAEFLAFNRLRGELPDVDAILAGKDVKLPPKSDVLFILCTNIIRAGKPEHVGAVAKLLHTLAATQDEKGMYQGAEVSAYLYNECLHGAGKGLRGLRANVDAIRWVGKFGKEYFSGQ
jgi:hypothetical protein